MPTASALFYAAWVILFLFGDDQADVAALAQIHDAHLAGVRILEDVEAVAEQVELFDRLFRGHGREFKRLCAHELALGKRIVREEELFALISEAEKLGADIYTTSKDYVKIPSELKNRFKVLEIAIQWEDETALLDFILKHI